MTRHRLVGYDRRTEWVAAEYPLSAQAFAQIRPIARVDRADPEGIGSYPLSGPQAQEIGRIIGAALDTKKMDFFLEPAP